jgi:hypothetical protein
LPPVLIATTHGHHRLLMTAAHSMWLLQRGHHHISYTLSHFVFNFAGIIAPPCIFGAVPHIMTPNDAIIVPPCIPHHTTYHSGSVTNAMRGSRRTGTVTAHALQCGLSSLPFILSHHILLPHRIDGLATSTTAAEQP